MSEAERPDPDALLARLKREEAESARGKLKIFFGMSPGCRQDLRHVASRAAETS